jgi:hypothetical protein
VSEPVVVFDYENGSGEQTVHDNGFSTSEEQQIGGDSILVHVR